MSVESLIGMWKKGQFKPLTLLHGEEDYFIDQAVDYAEHHILTPEESSFNLTVFYGKDAEWASVINACRRYPMFAEKQVVLLKEAQTMKDLDKLEPYFEAPLASTIFIIAHKGKTLDKRSKLTKILIKNGQELKADKVSEYKIREWIMDYAKKNGLAISSKALQLFYDHVGNDLSRIVGEIEKLKLNLNPGEEITEDAIEKYIGISKEYNIFELQTAIVNRNLAAAIKIINYFEANPKAAPLQAALPALYSFYSKVHTAFGVSDRSDAAMRAMFYNSGPAVEQARMMMRNYGLQGVEKMILLLNHYNLKGVGVGDTGTEHASLLKEMVVKMMMS